jgi:hypothetical protein
MPDFYQVGTTRDRNGNEVMDLDKLNFVLREMFKRLDRLDSLKGAVQEHAETDMGGHKITGGPPNFISAADTDFITKAYLGCREAAELIRSNLRPNGKAPLTYQAPTP